MPDIKASVGSGGHNDFDDVLIVQTLLNQIPIAEGGAFPVLDLDGWAGQGTSKAITAFQIKQFKFSDGRVDPGKQSITRLNALSSAPGARPVPAQDPDAMALARLSPPQALLWANAALAAVTGAINGGIGSANSVVQAAFAAHFKLTSGTPDSVMQSSLSVIQSNYTKAIALLLSGGPAYKTVRRKQMSIDLGGGEAPGYTFFSRSICYTPLFHERTTPGTRPGLEWTTDGWGPKCRAAMVLHEPVHFVDPQGNFDTYEHGSAYQTLPTNRAIHNASSYPSFAAHVQENSPLPSGPLYGAGRPAD